jgi:hypothetical protein
MKILRKTRENALRMVEKWPEMAEKWPKTSVFWRCGGFFFQDFD